VSEIDKYVGQIIQGDCLEVLKGLPDGSVDMVWTDPPYGHGNMDGDLQAARVRDKVSGGRVAAVEPIANDSPEEFRQVFDGMITEVARVLKPDCCCCCCCCGGGPQPTFAWTSLRLDDNGMQFFHAVIWDKSGRGNGMGWRYRRNYEFVMVAHRRSGRLLWSNTDIATPNIVRFMPVIKRTHPNEKPVEMVKHFLKLHAKPGSIILDPFCGSGSTLVACVEMGLPYIGIELDPGYCAIARRRIAEASEQQDMFRKPAETQGVML
jgi:DNA modification methylase